MNFSELFHLSRQIQGLDDFSSKLNYLGYGPFLLCSDQKVRYDLRPAPIGPGLLGHMHPLILKVLFEEKVFREEQEQRALLEWRQLLEQIEDQDLKNWIHENFLFDFSHHIKEWNKNSTLNLTEKVSKLLASAPLLGVNGRIQDMTQWIKGLKEFGLPYQTSLKLSLPLKVEQTELLFQRGLLIEQSLSPTLYFPLSLLPHHLEEIKAILSEVMQ